MLTNLRILEAITPSRIGGAEVFVARLCEELPKLGASVELFCPAGRPFVDYAAKRGIGCITWKTCGKLDPVTVVRLARLIRQREIDVIHTHLSTAGLLGAFAARLARKPSVAHVHGLNTATCFRYSNVIIAVSEAVKDHLRAQGIDGRKIRVVHNGVDPEEFKPMPVAEAKSKLGYDAESPLFGVFGRLSSEKGQRTALEAMSLLAEEFLDARLVIVGDGRERADLDTAARALGIADRVRFAGFVPDVRDLMRACNAVIVPSVKEGFGLAAVEAMVLERPVVASAVGGLPEIVVQGETGFLVPPNDSRAISRALSEVIRDKVLADRLGKSGRGRVIESFDLKKQIAQVFDVLRGVK